MTKDEQIAEAVAGQMAGHERCWECNKYFQPDNLFHYGMLKRVCRGCHDARGF